MLGINPLVVLIASTVSLGLGVLWNSRFVFGRRRTEFSPTSHSDIGNRAGIKYKLPAMLVAEFVIAYTLAYLIALTGSYSLSALFELIFWVWLGFSAAVLLNYVFRGGQPWPIYFINISYHLVSWTTTGLIVIYLSKLL
jgi:hypothetical protein